jgi:hypothetical protein
MVSSIFWIVLLIDYYKLTNTDPKPFFNTQIFFHQIKDIVGFKKL